MRLIIDVQTFVSLFMKLFDTSNVTGPELSKNVGMLESWQLLSIIVCESINFSSSITLLRLQSDKSTKFDLNFSILIIFDFDTITESK